MAVQLPLIGKTVAAVLLLTATLVGCTAHFSTTIPIKDVTLNWDMFDTMVDYREEASEKEREQQEKENGKLPTYAHTLEFFIAFVIIAFIVAAANLFLSLVQEIDKKIDMIIHIVLAVLVLLAAICIVASALGLDDYAVRPFETCNPDYYKPSPDEGKGRECDYNDRANDQRAAYDKKSKKSRRGIRLIPKLITGLLGFIAGVMYLLVAVLLMFGGRCGGSSGGQTR